MPQNYKKRRPAHGPSKNELRSARNERLQERLNAGTLRKRFPQVGRLQLDYKLESATGAPLDQVSRVIELDEPLELEIICPSTCGNGTFDLADRLENAVSLAKDSHDGLGICQTPSYMDPRAVCGTKLHYRFTIEYTDIPTDA